MTWGDSRLRRNDGRCCRNDMEGDSRLSGNDGRCCRNDMGGFPPIRE